ATGEERPALRNDKADRTGVGDQRQLVRRGRQGRRAHVDDGDRRDQRNQPDLPAQPAVGPRLIVGARDASVLRRRAQGGGHARYAICAPSCSPTVMSLIAMSRINAAWVRMWPGMASMRQPRIVNVTSPTTSMSTICVCFVRALVL